MKANDRQVAGEHYHAPIQHWDLVVANGIPYLEAMALKYIMRHDKKNGREDLLKAQHFIEKMIEEYYPEAPQAVPPATVGGSTSTAQEAAPARSQGVVGLCSNNTNGQHGWSSVYKHDKDGRMVEVMKCDWCQMEQFKP